MGVNSRLRDIRPPLPAPTESMDEGGYSGLDTDVATNVTTRTDKTSYEIPEDGSPIVISTDKITGSKESVPGHQRGKSQTSLLIEYFEGSKTGDRTKSRPSVRVKVTPSSRKKSGSGGPDAVQITGIGKDRKASYTRRISLGSNKTAEIGLAPPEGTEVSQSSESNLSTRPPVEIEVLDHNASDLSTRSRNLMYAPNDSNVSSMPPDSMLEGSEFTASERSRGLDRDDDITVKGGDYLDAPTRERSARSASRERIAQKVMEKLGQSGGKKSSKSKSDRSLGQEYDRSVPITDRRRRSSKNDRYEADTVTGAESSLLSSDLAPSQRSIRSGSDISNNPKLLGMVEDTIKRIILPEINAIKKDQRDDRNYRSFESSRRGSILDETYERGGLGRSLSKSSSTPNISSKPKVVLNRDGDDPGTVLSRGDSERKKMKIPSQRSYTEERSSSRRSSGKRDGYDDETVRQKPSSSDHKLRDTAAAGMVGGILTAAALKHHDSQGDDGKRRKKRTKSRGSGSRSASIADYNEEAYMRKEDIPPMPLASHINDSEITRESIVSTGTEMPSTVDSGTRTPVREVSRGSFRDAVSPASPRTATRTPVSRGGLGMSHSNQSIESPRSVKSGHSTKDRIAALGAAGLGGVAIAKGAEEFTDRDSYGDTSTSQRKISSPVQSISSLKKNFEEEQLVPADLRPRSAASRSSAGRLRSNASSPSTKIARSRRQSQNMAGEDDETPLHEPEAGYLREATPGTPAGEDVDDWYERQHQLNNQYRNSLDAEDSNRDSFAATNRDSYQTNPYPQDEARFNEKRFTQFTDDSQDYQGADSPAVGEEKGLRHLGANPQYIHTPYGAESAVASLIMEPSTVSSHKLSPSGSPTKGSYSDRMAAHLQEMGKDTPPIYQGSTLSQTMPSQDRWAAIKGQARNLSASPLKSGSPAERTGDKQRQMSSSAVPLASDPLPEIGHFDETRSEVSTNPSIIQGPLGGDATGKETWPYSPELEQRRELSARDSQSLKSGHGRADGMLGAAAAGGAALAAAHAMKQPTVEDEQDVQRRPTPGGGEFIDREATPTSAAGFRDEGYVTDAHARSAGALTPLADQQRPYSKKEVDEFNRAMDQQDVGDDDPFMNNEKHARHISGNSHGMASPLYDSATGGGKDHIQSKDIVALMDHLTVRDAQRNARDTEILVSLVRSATEMRQSFDEMKRFIVEQDRMIMQNADRGIEQTAQRMLSGPRPQPTSSPRTPRQSTEDIQTKRKGVLQRALKGLTRGKSANDLAKVEDMLMQILDNVEDLKHQGGVSREPLGSYTNDSLDTYERLRNAPDSGYEPEGQAGTSSTPSHSGNLSVTPRGDKQQFHSGYNGRPGSENRVSTVLEGDEDDELEPHERHVLNHQFEEGERFNTPTQESQRQRELAASNTPPRGAAEPDITPRSTDKQQKHKSNGSSILGVPKVSRWSKTTTSSAAPEYDSPNVSRNQRPLSDASRSQSSLGGYDDDKYSMRSEESLAREQNGGETRSMRSQASRLTRTPSPLIPSEASFKQRDDYYEEGEPSPIQEDFDPQFDDPKYHAHRNSLLLQHPQPRQGTTGRHQNTLETQASRFDDGSGTNSDLSQRTVSDFDPAMWGSSGTAGLAKHRLTQFEPLSPVSLSSPRDDGPLVPQQKPAVPPKQPQPEPEPEEDWEPTYSNSGFSRGGYSYNNYSSPFGSGHLLEPIEEVRYSLETDSGHSPEPQVASAQAVNMRSPVRKITGPRPMGGSRSPKPASGTVRRKPLAGSRASEESL